MRHCAAFVPSNVSPEFWMPCTAPAIARELFCVVHRDAVDGAMLGLHVAKVMRPRKTIRSKKRESRATRTKIVGPSSLTQKQGGVSRAVTL